MTGVAFFDIDSFQLEEGVVATEYEPPAPTPEYPIEIHSLNDFNVMSSVGKENLLRNSGNFIDTTHWAPYTSISSYEIAEKRMIIKTEDSGNPRLINGTLIPLNSKPQEFTVSVEYIGGGGVRVLGKSSSSATNRNESGAQNVGSLNLLGQIDLGSGKKRVIYEWNTLVETETIKASWLMLSIPVSSTIELINMKIERGNTQTPWVPELETIVESDNHPLIDKINLSLDEPLRSVGDVKDRLFRDSDGLWKVERKVSEYVIREGIATMANENNVLGVSSYGFGRSNFPSTPNQYSGEFSSTHFNASENRYNDAPLNSISRNAGKGLLGHNFYFNVSTSKYPKIGDFNNWLLEQNDMDRPVRILYEVENPAIETLAQEIQDKLNNLRSFQDSNYVYTIINNKTDIISENLKPTLHAIFKSSGWYNRWKTEDELRKHQAAIDDKANNSDLDETIRTIETESEKIASLRTDIDITKNNMLITHTDEYINKIITTESSLDGLENRVVSVEEIKENVDTFFQFDDAFTIGKSNAQTKLRMTNDEIQFLDGETKGTYITGNTMVSQNITIQDKLNLTKHTMETEGDVTVIRFIG